MADAAPGLRIKYGLERIPSQDQVTAWASLTRDYQSRGLALEQAGATAAKLLFPDYNTRHYASQADTLEALLRAAEGK